MGDFLKFNLILICAIFAAPMLGDEPLPPPTKVSVWSEDHGFFVESVPDGGTTLYRMPAGQAIWKIPDWHRSVFVSNVGVVAIVLRRPELASAELQTQYRTHRVVARWTVDLSDTVEQRNPELEAPSTLSFPLLLGYIVGFSKNNLLEVVTVEGKFTIDPQDRRLQKWRFRLFSG